MTTIATIPTAMLTHGAVLHCAGRDAPFDGGGGTLHYDATSTAPADGGIVYTVAGAPGRLLRQGYTLFGHAGDVEAAWFGVGRSPGLSAAGLAAIKASPHIGKVTVRLPGRVVLDAPFVNDVDGLFFRGHGGTGYMPDAADDALLAASGTIVEAGPAFPLGAVLWTDTAKTTPGSLPRNGGGLAGVTLNARKRAAVAHSVLSVAGADFEDVYTLNPIDIGLSFGVVKATDGSRIGSGSRNRFQGYGGGGGRVGAALWGDVSVGSNACLSTFTSCAMRGTEWGWEFGNCDSNWFFGCGGTPSVLHAGDTCPRSLGDKTRSARGNVFVAWQGGITAKANVSPLSPPSYRNIMLGFSRENGAALNIEPGAKLVVLVDQTKELGDCAGHMLGLEPSGFLASLKLGGQVIKTGVWTPCVWGLEHYETPANVHAALAAEVVVPAGAIAASVSAALLFADTQAKGRLSARLLLNGAELPTPVFADERSAGCGPLSLNSPTLKVQAGDTITVQVQQTTGADLALLASSWLGVEWQ